MELSLKHVLKDKEKLIIHIKATKKVVAKCNRCGEIIFSDWEASIDEGFEGFLKIIDLDELALLCIASYPSIYLEKGDELFLDASIDLTQ
jgi:hypothetical protein